MQGHTVCLLHHQRVSTFTTPILSWTDSLDGSHLSPHLIAVSCLPLPRNGAAMEKKGKIPPTDYELNKCKQASLKAGAGLWRAKTTVEVEALVRTDERTAKQRQCVCSWEGIFQNANQCSDIESAKCQLRCYTNREFSLGPVTVHFLIINTSLQEISTEIVHSLSQMYTFIPKTQKQTNK